MNYKWLKQNAFFIILLLVAILLRFIPLGTYQLSHDELSALSRTVFPDLRQEILYGVQYTDTHPFLIQIFLFYWIKIAGSSEIAVKLPFLVCGVLSAWAIYRFTKKRFGLQSALYAQLIVSASFIFVLYSSYARMYAPGLLFSILLLQALFSLSFEARPVLKDFIMFGLFCLLCAFNNHLDALFAFTCAVAGLFLIPRQHLLKYLFTCGAVVLCYLPHLSITLTQLQAAGLGTQDNGWLPPPKSTVLFDFLKTLFGTGYSGWLILGISVVVIISGIARKRLSKKQCLLLLLFMVNYGIIHLYSIFRSPVLQYSVLLFSAPCLLVFIASFYDGLNRKLFYGLSTLILCALLCQGIFVKHELGDVSRQQFDMTAMECLDQYNDHGDATIRAIITAEPYFIQYYEHKYSTAINYKLSADSLFSDPKSTRAYFAGLPPSVSHMVLGDVSPMLVALAGERFPLITAHRQGCFYNVLSLADSSSDRPGEPDDALIREYRLFSDPAFFKLETPVKPVNGAYALDSVSGEFPFAYKAPVSGLHLREGQWLLVEVDFETPDPALLKEDLLCLSINTKDSTRNYFTAARFAGFITGKHSGRLYLQVFIGSDSEEWSRSGELACFVWKKDRSTLELRRLTMKQLDYNPAKWTLWE